MPERLSALRLCCNGGFWYRSSRDFQGRYRAKDVFVRVREVLETLTVEIIFAGCSTFGISEFATRTCFPGTQDSHVGRECRLGREGHRYVEFESLADCADSKLQPSRVIDRLSWLGLSSSESGRMCECIKIGFN